MLRELAHQDSDAEKRAGTAQIPEIALVRRAAQPLDVGLEVKRRPVRVADADETGSDPEGMDGPWRHRGGFACGQRAPLAPDQDVQRAGEHLVLLGEARMDVWG